MPVHPNTTATGSETDFQSKAVRVLQIAEYPGLNWLKEIELSNSRVSLRSDLFAVDNRAPYLLKVGVKVEISTRAPDAIYPSIETELAAMIGEKFLP
jgi:hypothetical protein